MNLYTFTTENEILTLTSAKTNVNVAGIEYVSTALKRTEYALDSLIAKNTINIMFTGDNTFAKKFMTETTLSLTVVIATITGIPFYRGKLVTVEYSPDDIITLVFEPIILLGNKTTGSRRIYQRNCPYEVYDRATCMASPVYNPVDVIEIVSTRHVKVRYDTGDANNGDRGDFRFNVIPINGTLTDGKVNIGFLIGGLLVPIRGAIGGQSIEKRLWIINITDRVAQGSLVEFVIVTFLEHDLTVGERVEVVVGCKRTTQACRDIHANIHNFGGFPGLTKASPFAGGLRN